MKQLLLFCLTLLFSGMLYAQSTFNVNDRVEVLYQGKWYKATVLKVDGERYFVHWDGYSASYDSWAKKDEVRPMGSGASSTSGTNSNASSAASSNNKYKSGDKVVYLAEGFPTGTVSGYKNGMCLVEFTDPRHIAQGKQGIEDKWLLEPWSYKEFYTEVEALCRRDNSKINDLARMVCDQCNPSGQRYSLVTIDYLNQAKKDYADLKAIVKKYEPLPSTINKNFRYNPSVVKMVSEKSDSIYTWLVSGVLADRATRWFNLDSYFIDITNSNTDQENALAEGKRAEDFVMCGDISQIKPHLVANLEKAFAMYGVKGSPEDLLKGFDEAFRKRKEKLEAEAADNAWVKNDYPYLDATFNKLIESGVSLKILKTFYNVQSFQVHKDDYGYITEQTKGGVAIYEKPGCGYWMWQYITVFKPYKGNGTYGAAQVRYMDYGFIKPF
jgi:hypothetical protein